MDHDSDPYWDALVAERFPRTEMSDDVLDRIDKYKDAPGVYLAAERERCARAAETYKDREKVRITDFTIAHDFAAERIAAAIRALPEPQS